MRRSATSQSYRKSFTRSPVAVETLEKRLLFAVDITLDGAQRFQTIEGFGSALADYNPGPNKYVTDAWQNMFFQDLGSSILRVSMFNQVAGGPDGNHTTHDFDFTGNYATDLANMNFAKVAAQKSVAVGGQTKKLDQLKVIMSMWTPPGWMKGPEVDPYTGVVLSPTVNPVYNGADSSRGSMIDTPANWTQFGRYVATYVKGWQDYTGVQVYGISLQNELANWTSYSSCVYSYALYGKAVQAVHDAFVTYGLTTKLMGPEHFGLGTTANPAQAIQMQRYINAVQPTFTDNGLIQTFITHNYGVAGDSLNGRYATVWDKLWNGDGSNLKGLKNYGKELWQTEEGGSHATWAGAMEMAGKEQDALIYGNVSAWLEWQTTEGDTLGDYNLTAGTDGLLKGDKFYAARQFSKFIRPGSVRISATPNSTTGVEVSAYVNDTNQTETTVLLNQTATAQTVNIHLSNLTMSSFTTYMESMSGSWGLAKPTVTFSGGIATITMPAQSIVTLQGSIATASASIAGIVYTDNDDNAANGAGDTPFSNVRIYDDVNLNGAYDSATEPSVLTNASGAYTLTGLAAGTHRVKVVVPAGYRATQPTSGQYDITLTAGQAANAAALGLTPKAKFSGTAYIDNDNSGGFSAGDSYYGGSQVYIDTNLDGAYQTGEPTRTTDTWGLYSFNNMAPGTYRVRVVNANNYVVTAPSAGYLTVTVTAGQLLTSQSIGVRQQGTAQIQGTLYKDNDNSGSFTSGDSYVTGGVMVWLDYDNDGVKDANEPSTTTDPTWGQYHFYNLLAGSYRVRVGGTVSGWHIATPVVGYIDLTLTSGQVLNGQNFAYQLG